MFVGLVGKPSTGKSTFFRAATLASAEIANYPFTTIEPNTGMGYVKVKDPAKDFGKVSNPREGYVVGDYRFVPVKVVDVAGLVPDAHLGRGRGNQFLDDLRQVDALIHVIDVSGSTNEKGEPVQPGTYDPAEDIKFLEIEMDMWYYQIIRKGWERFARSVMQEKQEIQIQLAKQLSGLQVTEDLIEDTIKKLQLNKAKPDEWNESQLKNLATELRIATKPMIIAANKIDIPGANQNFQKLKTEFPEHILIPCSAESELALREAAKAELIDYIPGEGKFNVLAEGKLNEKQQKALDFVQEHILGKFKSTGIQQVLDQAVFKLLNYIAIFPGGVNKLEDQHGNVLPDCFLMPPKSTALDFAYKLHTDFGKNFIRAIDVKTKRTVGKEHQLKSGDILEIVSGK